MKKMALAFGISTLFSIAVFAQTPAPPATSVGVAGKIAIINTSKFGQGILELKVKLEALNRELEPKQKELQALEEEFNSLKNKFQTQSAVISPQVRFQLLEDLNAKELGLKRKGEDYETLVKKRLADVSEPVYAKIQKSLASFFQQNGIVVAFDGSAYESGVLSWYAPAADVTDNFIAEYNKANPVAADSSTGTKRN